MMASTKEAAEVKPQGLPVLGIQGVRQEKQNAVDRDLRPDLDGQVSEDDRPDRGPRCQLVGVGLLPGWGDIDGGSDLSKAVPFLKTEPYVLA
jgi:hypothetical protein